MATTIRSRLALVVAALFAAVGIFELMSDHDPEVDVALVEGVDYVLEWLFAAAAAATVVALVIFARSLGSRGARVAAISAAVGHGLLALAAGATAITGRESLDAAFGAGVILLLLGYVTLTVLDVRRRVHPPRTGVVLLVGYIGAMVTDGIGIGGGFMLAASWAAVAHLSTRGLGPAADTVSTVSQRARRA